jgi:hypothetical protein
VLDISMAEVSLEGARIMPSVRQSETASMSQHVRVRLKWQFGHLSCPLEHPGFEQRSREPRFADPGLAGEEHHLTTASLSSRPAAREQFEFFLPPDEGGEAGRVQRFKAAFYRTRPQRRPRPYWLRDTLDFLGPKVLQLEEITQKFSRALGDDDGIWFGGSLQARCQIGSPTIPRSCASPDPITSPITTSPVAIPTRVCSGLDDFNALTDETSSKPARTARSAVVLVGLRIAEIHQHAVAHVLCDEAAEALHSLGDAILIAGNDLAEVPRSMRAESAVEPTKSQNITVT